MISGGTVTSYCISSRAHKTFSKVVSFMFGQVAQSRCGIKRLSRDSPSSAGENADFRPYDKFLAFRCLDITAHPFRGENLIGQRGNDLPGIPDAQ